MSRKDTETPLPSSILFKRDHAFIPSLGELTGYFVVSLIILVTATVLPVLQARESEAYSYITDSISNFVGERLASLSGTRWATITTAFVWMLVGMATYLVIWVAAVILHAYKNDIPATRGFIAPQGLVEKSRIVSTLARIIVRTFGLVGVVVWFILLLGAVVPNSMQLFIDALTVLDAFSALKIIGAVLTLAFSMHVIAILFRIVVLKRRVFGA